MKNDKYLGEWLKQLTEVKPLVIAGPCSAESEQQVLQIAHEIKSSVQIFRAGIWKPRTRPGGFEGVGEIGLMWLQKAKRETGLMMAVEVANSSHVKLALEYDMDVLWIGARTTVNPFAVQEIADSLKGTGKIVLVKNPVNPDLALWLGGIERLYNAGIKKLGVIHRGFSTYEKTNFRNVPEWQLVIELQNRFPDLPLICDPSHITGKRNMIQKVSQQALDLNYDGLIIETHIDPDNAFSDSSQQITPSELKRILKELVVRKVTDNSNDFVNELQKLRFEIDIYDEKIMDILGERMKIAEKIGALKKLNNVAVFQNDRWNEILEKMKKLGLDNGLNEEFVLKLIKAIHQESIDHQEKVMLK